MNQQSDSTDLLGGYKPVDISHTMHNILQSFTKAIQLPKCYQFLFGICKSMLQCTGFLKAKFLHNENLKKPSKLTKI
jgi:hypothetical protein